MSEYTKELHDPFRITKEVFNDKHIMVKTELDATQIMRVNKLKTLALAFGCGLLDHHVNDFMKLQKSKNRASLREFVESLKSKKDELLDKSKNFHLLG